MLGPCLIAGHINVGRNSEAKPEHARGIISHLASVSCAMGAGGLSWCHPELGLVGWMDLPFFVRIRKWKEWNLDT